MTFLTLKRRLEGNRVGGGRQYCGQHGQGQRRVQRAHLDQSTLSRPKSKLHHGHIFSGMAFPKKIWSSFPGTSQTKSVGLTSFTYSVVLFMPLKPASPADLVSALSVLLSRHVQGRYQHLLHTQIELISVPCGENQILCSPLQSIKYHTGNTKALRAPTTLLILH